LKIREKWDPKGLFPHYKSIVRTHERINQQKQGARL